MEVVIEKCQNSRTRNVTSAYVFNICANAHSKYKSHYAPMLVEIEGEPNEEYACLADSEYMNWNKTEFISFSIYYIQRR